MRGLALVVALAAAGLFCFTLWGGEPDGAEVPKPKKGPKKLNRLAKEKSAYLRQHATNPVDWFPWGEEAFEKARKENKPIFLSIGYSSCHWCHVMEHESFDDETVAAYLNEHFVCIKVDREERPDVDEIYMNALQLMRIPGGWPLSMWLTPDKKPFVGGTYFPPERKFGRPAFLDVLKQIQAWWTDADTRAQIDKRSAQIADLVQEVYDMEEPEAIDDGVLDNARAMADAGYDEALGGFAQAPHFQPKFPSPSTLEMLLRASLRGKDEQARKMVLTTLDRMALGGIHDHVGGGFHRYSVTRNWLVPHFEKMLYDNGPLLGLYAWAYQLTGNEIYKDTAADVARWVQREMTHAEGGFFAAQDADDPGGPEGEGGFYIWNPKTVRAVLDGNEAEVFLKRFDIGEKGNWIVNGEQEKPGESILEVKRSHAEVAKMLGLKEKEVQDLLASGTQKLYLAREERPKPITDTKVLAGWNGLMISGFCKAYQVFHDESYLASALNAGRFLKTQLIGEKQMMRRWSDGEAAHDAVLADYAYVIAAFLDLYETTFDEAWLAEALRLKDLTVELFYDEKEGGFWFTSKTAEKLIARGKPGTDNARPSGNGSMVFNLLRVASLTGDSKAREMAEKTLRFFGARVTQSALGFSTLLNAIDWWKGGANEIFIAGPKDDPRTRALIEAVWNDPRPNRVLALVTPGVEKLLPPAAGKEAVAGAPAAYVCRNFTCKAPVTKPEEIAAAR